MREEPLYTSVIMAGFGGQGLMFIGKLLAYSAMRRGLNVTYIPSYGPEMRGGTANCTVVISTEKIGSPLIRVPQSAIVMNNPSMEAFAPRVKQGGLLLFNSSLVTFKCERSDITVIAVPANDEAAKAGEPKAANMVMLGSYLARAAILSREDIEAGLSEFFGSKGEGKLGPNMKAFDAGTRFAQPVLIGQAREA